MQDGINFGSHYVVDLWGAPFALLNDALRVVQILESFADEMAYQRLHSYHHAFSPQGLTAVVVLAESHLAIHTWPEHGFAALDFYSCSKNKINKQKINELVSRFEATNAHLRLLPRELQFFTQLTDAPEVSL